MTIKINNNISLWREYNPIELAMDYKSSDTTDIKLTLARMGFNKERVSIQGRWFDVIPLGELVRSRNKSDGYFRVIYIQINMNNGEYYIGKANRPKWSEIKRYQGSGLKFKNKFKNNKNDFVRYFIAICDTAEETEALESSIVNSSLLSDEKCLNLVAGGAGITNRKNLADSSIKKREYMKKHPEQFEPMLKAAKEAFSSGDSPALRARNRRIKEVMSDNKYREMSRERLSEWKKNNPIKYAEARLKNREKIKSSEVQKKRQESLKKWAQENPEEHKIWQEKLVKSRTSPSANSKRKSSLAEWKIKNPLMAFANASKRARAAAVKTSKEVSMIDLRTGKILKNFASMHEAARWLVSEGIAKNINSVTSISGVCKNNSGSKTSRGRTQAYGFGWKFKE